MTRRSGVRAAARRWTAALASALALGVACGAPACADARRVPVADCPGANARYSVDSALLDLLLEPGAKAALERLAPSVVKPPFGEGAWPLQPPTFAAILTPRAALAFFPSADAVSLDGLDAELARVPITREALRLRCARYDAQRPSLPAALPRPAMLVFEKMNGFRDAPSVDAAGRALRDIAVRRGWSLYVTTSGAVFNAADLARFDVVVWNNVSGDALTLPQRAAFRRWIERGGGFAGIHGSGGDPVYFWDWYADTLIGARFTGHPSSPQFQTARVVVEDRGEITQGLPAEWSLLEEWYSFAASPRSKGVRVLATLDERSYVPETFGGRSIRMGDHPIAWTHCIADGRSFYTAIGHRPEVYSDPNAARLLEQGLVWAAGLGTSSCREASR